MTAIEKILMDYDTGAITERERVIALARLVTPETVETIFASIPAEVGADLLDWAQGAPLGGGLVIGGELSKAAGDRLAEQLRGAVRAIQAWNTETERRKNGSPVHSPGAVGTRRKAE